jgi:hypothetical protein
MLKYVFFFFFFLLSFFLINILYNFFPFLASLATTLR